MMKIIRLLTCSLALTWAIAPPFASAGETTSTLSANFGPIPPPLQPADCVLDRNDRFDPAARFVRGPYRGECIDTRSHRSIHLLSKKEIAEWGLSARPGTTIFANFFHEGRFHIAVLEPSGVEEVIWQIEYFPAVVPAAHAQIRVRFREDAPIHLIDQSDPARPVSVLREMVISDEATPPLRGESYNLIRGMQDRFAMAYRFVSLSDQYKTAVTISNHRVRQLRLRLSAAQKSDLVSKALLTSDAASLDRMYHTLKLSCAIEAFKNMDAALGVPFFRRFWVRLGKLFLTDIWPNQAAWALRARGLLYPKGGSTMPDLDQDPTAQ